MHTFRITTYSLGGHERHQSTAIAMSWLDAIQACTKNLPACEFVSCIRIK